MIALKAGTERVKAEEIDSVRDIDSKSLLFTDTATYYKKFAKLKGLPKEVTLLQTNVSICSITFYYPRLEPSVDTNRYGNFYQELHNECTHQV